jgi:2-aminoadipate transaminase
MPFYPCGGGHNTMRINFSNATSENILEGIRRLGDVLSEMVGDKVAA